MGFSRCHGHPPHCHPQSPPLGVAVSGFLDVESIPSTGAVFVAFCPHHLADKTIAFSFYMLTDTSLPPCVNGLFPADPYQFCVADSPPEELLRSPPQDVRFALGARRTECGSTKITFDVQFVDGKLHVAWLYFLFLDALFIMVLLRARNSPLARRSNNMFVPSIPPNRVLKAPDRTCESAPTDVLPDADAEVSFFVSGGHKVRRIVLLPMRRQCRGQNEKTPFS